MITQNIILDCDPGVDDAVAVLLALATPRLNVLGITTVAGNVDIDKITRNARLLRQVAQREDVPVHRGCDKPLVRPAVLADDFHGADGLGTYPVFEPNAPEADESGVDFIVAMLREHPPNSISLAVTGPLTNVATALSKAPDIASRILSIVVMGGARREGGNITASAEYNIYADPDAAAIVFEARCPLVVLGLDATHQVRATPQRIAQLQKLRNPMGALVCDTLAFSNTLAGNLEDATGAPLHDPCVIAYFLAPELFTLRPCSIQVETRSDLTRGHTGVEFRPDYRGVPYNAQWVTHIDADGVFALLETALSR